MGSNARASVEGFASTIMEVAIDPDEPTGRVIAGSLALAVSRADLLGREVEPDDLAFAFALFCWWPLKIDPPARVRSELVDIRRALFAQPVPDLIRTTLETVPAETLRMSMRELEFRQARGAPAYLTEPVAELRMQRGESEPYSPTLELAARYSDVASDASFAHYRQTRRYRVGNYVLGGVAASLALGASVAMFISVSVDPSYALTLSVGIAALMSASLAGLLATGRFGEAAQRHRQAAGEYQRVVDQLRLLQLQREAVGERASWELRQAVAQLSQLEETT